ncbi:MAG: cysteine desulfurase [Turicibacter sp.]|nr:cysteine desulfurase [Turicibacter sp.]
MIYLDHSATTNVADEVMDTFVKATANFWGNPSSLHNFGALAEQVLIKSSRQVLDLFSANHHQVIFTSGATESNNLAIKGLARHHPGGHIITTHIEHPSVYEVCLQLEKQGYRISYLDVTKSSAEIVMELERLITKDTFLVSCMHVNSEMGLILPIKEMGAVIAKHPKAKYHVDAVQSVGKLEVNITDMNIDLLSLSAHKIHGIKGVGALVIRQNLQLEPQIVGGGQMGNVRSGTVNAPGAASFAKALRLVCEERTRNFESISQLHSHVLSRLQAIKDVQVNSCFHTQSPYIINFCVAGIRGETLVHALEEHGVYISSKSACSSKTKKASYVLLALGFDESVALESVRVSFAHTTTMEEVDGFITALKTEIAKLT